MKRFLAGIAVVGLAFCGFARDDEFNGDASILSVQELSQEDNDGVPEELLKITTTQSDAEMPGEMRVSVELKDKNNKTYFGKIKIPTPKYKLSLMGAAPTGYVEWKIMVDSSLMRRPKFTGYSIEFFYDGEGESQLLDAEYEDCDSAEELAVRNEDSIAIKLNRRARADFPKGNR